jgi:hypothetical protein
MISIAKHFGHRNLSHFFSIAKDSKLGLAHEDFLPA